MGKNRVHITYTKEEIAYFKARAAKRGVCLSAHLHEDLSKAFMGIEIQNEPSDILDKEEVFFDIQPRLWKIIYSASQRLGIRPGELVYRVAIAPHLIEIIRNKSLEAEVLSAD